MWGEAPVDHQLLWPFIPSTSLKQSSIALVTSGGSVQGITTLRKLGVVPVMTMSHKHIPSKQVELQIGVRN